MLRKIVQKHPMGCGIACIACVSDSTYSGAIKFLNARYAFTRGYYCRDIVKALEKLGLRYAYGRSTAKNKRYLRRKGTIVFIERSSNYPNGHYLAKTGNGWMNSWINYPKRPIKSGFNRRLPGKAQWILFEKTC
jgi:hypothetical protein